MRGALPWVSAAGAALLLLPPLARGGTRRAGPVACAGGDWPTYGRTLTRDADANSEASVSLATAGSVRSLWNTSLGSRITASPTATGGHIYLGAYNGNLASLDAVTGRVLRRTFLGVTHLGNDTFCVASSAAVAGGVVYVAGGNATMYALNTSTGAVLWGHSAGATSNGHCQWSSPLVIGSDVDIGVASLDDHPLVTGGLLAISLTGHHSARFFNTTALGTLGASVWTSPTLDRGTNTVYITTGNSGPPASVYGESIVAVNATTLHPIDAWAVPKKQAVTDGDSGGTPVLVPGADPLVLASNKNGLLYAFDADKLAQGPVGSRVTDHSSTGSGLANLGLLSVDGGRVFVGASAGSVGGTNYSGNVRAFFVATDQPLWAVGEPAGPVLGAPVAGHGVLVVPVSHEVDLLGERNGTLLHRLTLPAQAHLFGEPSVARGEILVGATNGRLYAFGPGGCTPGEYPSPASPGAPHAGVRNGSIVTELARGS